MNGVNDGKLGEAIQNYVRRKWRLGGQLTLEEAKNVELDEETKERVDALGVDDNLLLKVEPARVMGRLVELEADAILEDGGLRQSGHTVARAQTEKRIPRTLRLHKPGRGG